MKEKRCPECGSSQMVTFKVRGELEHPDGKKEPRKLKIDICKKCAWSVSGILGPNDEDEEQEGLI